MISEHHQAPMNTIAIAHTTKLLQIAKKSLARYKTMLKKEEAKMELLRAEADDAVFFSGAMTQSMWLQERREKSINRWERDVAELEARLAKLNSNA